MAKTSNKYTKYGNKLKQARTSQKLSKPAVARKLQISPEQVAAIENGSTKSWEGAYALGYVDGYRRILGLKEFQISDENTSQKPVVLEPLSEKSYIVSKLLASASVAIGVLLVLGYVFWQVLVLTSPPPLRLYSPAKDTVTNKTYIEIKGKTSENTDVSINGQSILTEPDGNFSAEIPLKPGLNELSITATNRLTKQNVVERTVIANYAIDAIDKN